MSEKRPRLEDVAALAGVSKTTVSRVLNNRGYLSKETIQKVNDAMKEIAISQILLHDNSIHKRLT